MYLFKGTDCPFDCSYEVGSAETVEAMRSGDTFSKSLDNRLGKV